MLRSQVHSVAHPQDIQAGTLLKTHHLPHIYPLGAVWICLGGFDKVGLGVDLDEIGHIRIVHAVSGDEAELAGEGPYLRPLSDFEEVLGIAVLRIYSRAEEVVVEVLCLLVSCKEHQPSAAFGDPGVAVHVFAAALCRHIQGDYDLFHQSLHIPSHRICLFLFLLDYTA